MTRCPLPAWIDGEVGSEAKADLPIAPTALGGEKTAPGAAADPRSLERGQLVHALLEHLPGVAEAERSSFCEKYLSEKAVGREDADFVASRVERLLASPGLASIFDPDALAEVEVSARIAELGGRAIRGKIDRLLVRDDFVLAIDFKTNPIVPETEAAVPEGLLRQMAAYHEALKQIWPERAVSVAILWTETGRLMELPEQVLLPALTRAGQS